MAWLISYRYRACYKHEDGIRYNSPDDIISLSKVHPAVFLAENNLALLALEQAEYTPSKGPQSAFQIERIYSAIEIPPEVSLTQKQLNAIDG